MSSDRIVELLAAMLEVRGLSYSPSSRLIADLGLDSQDLLGMVLELEATLDRELDDSILLMFAQAPLGDISAALGRLDSEPL